MSKEDLLKQLPELITQLMRLQYFAVNLLLYLNKDVQQEDIFYQVQTADSFECLLDAFESFQSDFEPIRKKILEYEDAEDENQ